MTEQKEVHAAITELIQNTHFKVKIEKAIAQLSTCPPTIEVYSIPELVLVILEFTGRHQVSINKVPLSELSAGWEELVMNVLERHDAIPDDEYDTYQFITRGCVKLLLVTPDTAKGSTSSWSNGFNWVTVVPPSKSKWHCF